MSDIEIDNHPDTGQEVVRFTAPFMQNQLIKNAGGAFNPRGGPDGTWWAPLTWATCVRARAVFGAELKVGHKLTMWSLEEHNRIREALHWRDAEGEGGFSGSDLYGYQHAGVLFLSNAPEALLADEMGTGKTATLLSGIRSLNGLPAVVVCPTAVRHNWTKEASRWLPEATPYEIAGTAPQRAKILARAATDPTALVVINIEAARLHSRLAGYGSVSLATCAECSPLGSADLTPAKCEKHPKELNSIPFRTFVIDEAHRLKDPKSKQTRAVWAIAHGPTVERRWAATGTPIANHPGDLWAVLHCVSPAQFPAKTKYVDRYCEITPNPFGGIDIVGLKRDRKAEFFSIFDPMFRRMTKERVLKFLPPKVRSIRYAYMSVKQAKAYKEIAKDYEAELGSGWLTVENDLVAAGRLVQFSSAYADVRPKPGTEADEEPKMEVFLQEPSNKVDAFMEILEDYGPDHPLVACAESRQLIELTSRRLEKENIPHVLITGAQTADERTRALESFQTGKVNLLLFTIKAGGTGLTMTRADTIVFLQRSWSMVDNKQAEDRVHRIGSEQHASVHVIDIVAPDTIEEVQIDRIHYKQALSDEVTRDA